VKVQLHAFFDFGSRWRCVVSFTPRPLYPQGKSPWYPLDRRMGGPQSRSGCNGEEKNFQPLPGLEPPIIEPVVQRWTTEFSRLLISQNQSYFPTDGRSVGRSVSQSVSHSVRPCWHWAPLGLMARFGCNKESYVLVYYGALSLTGGGVCLVTGHSPGLCWQYLHM
jgi:hypothetical protein